jgi:YVTN family beta-propeller protein
VISTATNTVIATIAVGNHPEGVAISPEGSKAYVTNNYSNTVSVIATATDTVIGVPIAVGSAPIGLALTPTGTKLYVANQGSNNVSVIATTTDTVIGLPIPVGLSPTAFGIFIQPAPAFAFAGTPGHSNCHGQSVAALAKEFGGIDAAAAALGFPSVQALQNTIRAFCRV